MASSNTEFIGKRVMVVDDNDRNLELMELLLRGQGYVVFLFNDGYKALEKVTEIQHEYHHQIVSATHIHMDHHNCLEVVIVKGKAGSINELADRLRSLRGVRNCKMAMSTTGKDLP